MKEINYVKFGNPTGRERNPCPLCDKSFNLGEETMNCIKSAYKGHISFGLIHSKCFFKMLLMKYDFDIDTIRKEIVIERLK